jgi:TM2 domain-containing membrane protein YozV
MSYDNQITRINIHDLTERELLILRQEVEDRKKSTATTWILWFFLGIFGAHRFYLGRIGTAVGMLLTLGGLWIWWIIDAFLISGMLNSNKRKTEKQVLEELDAMRHNNQKK